MQTFAMLWYEYVSYLLQFCDHIKRSDYSTHHSDFHNTKKRSGGQNLFATHITWFHFGATFANSVQIE